MSKEKESSVMRERLIALCDALGISRREFSISIGKTSTYVTSLNKDITVGVLNNIYIKYPQVNLMWLITGNGNILLEEPIKEELSNYLNNENKELKKENKELLLEVGKLQGIISEKQQTISDLKKERAHLGMVADCADAASYGLAK